MERGRRAAISGHHARIGGFDAQAAAERVGFGITVTAQGDLFETKGGGEIFHFGRSRLPLPLAVLRVPAGLQSRAELMQSPRSVCL